MVFEIEKGVLLPRAREKLLLYPWERMEVGDSFLVPVDDSGKKNNFYATARNAGKKYGRSFTARSVEGGVRVWRIK